jgi:hypothetical protein
MNNNCCANCNTHHDWYLLSEYQTPTGETLLLCDECREEEERIERLADQMAALPSCDYRAMIIDREQSTRVLVNALRAHDMSCSCSLRKPITAELLAPIAPAALVVFEGGVA